MIPAQNIVAWANVVPWVEPRQVEQDLIISRAQAQERIFAKLARPRLWLDVRPVAASRPGRCADDSGAGAVLSAGLHGPHRPAAGQALGTHGGDEGTVRHRMVNRSQVLAPKAAATTGPGISLDTAPALRGQRTERQTEVQEHDQPKYEPHPIDSIDIYLDISHPLDTMTRSIPRSAT